MTVAAHRLSPSRPEVRFKARPEWGRRLSARLWRALRFLAAGLVVQAGILGGLASASSEAERMATWEWTGVPRVVAVGDLHGNYQKLVDLLTAADLMDADLSWSGGESHLVVAGDFLDRGDDDRPVMDLLQRLERESVANGGRVHVLLGNHEVMNLMRDSRYVSPAAYRHFAADESKVERKRALGKYAKVSGGEWSSDSFRAFNEKFRPGFFARQRSFNPDGEYGSWLLQRPAIVKINGVLYVHGGLSEEFATLGIDDINRQVTAGLRRYLQARQVLEAEGVITDVMDLAQVGKAVEEFSRKKSSRSTRLRESARNLLIAANSPILGAQGPLWYRGNALQDERLERDTVERSLELLGATAMVVAHSPTSTRRITSRFQDRLFRIDHGIGSSETPLALVAEDGEILVLDSSTGERVRPFRELPLGQLESSRTAELPDDELSRFLDESQVIASRSLGRGSTRPRLVVLERAGAIRRGIFKSVESEGGADRYQHEVAAYRLDRAVGLGMVPVAVVRSLEGRVGSLQAWVDGAIDRETAQAYDLAFCDQEVSADQFARSRVFDALIGNGGRKGTDTLCLVRDQKVMLIDHSSAFATNVELPVDLAAASLLPAAMTEALRSLERDAVTSLVGELLTERQIESLLERRDRILERLEGVELSAR